MLYEFWIKYESAGFYVTYWQMASSADSRQMASVGVDFGSICTKGFLQW